MNITLVSETMIYINKKSITVWDKEKFKKIRMLDKDYLSKYIRILKQLIQK